MITLDSDSVQELLAPLFPGLIGMRITKISPDRVVATPAVRADLCTTGGILDGGATMAFGATLGAFETSPISQKASG